MANDIRYVVEKKDDGTWKGFGAFKTDMEDFPTGRYMITCRKYRKSRSSKQNGFYWGCVIPYVIDGLVDMGFEKRLLNAESVHHMLREKFLKEDVPNDVAEFITLVKSTTDLSTIEFMEYIADIQQWAQTFLNIYIPDPGEQTEINY